jgi:hypothetical protein
MSQMDWSSEQVSEMDMLMHGMKSCGFALRLVRITAREAAKQAAGAGGAVVEGVGLVAAGRNNNVKSKLQVRRRKSNQGAWSKALFQFWHNALLIVFLPPISVL